MSIFHLSTGANAKINATGEAELGGGGGLIPKNTTLKAMITEAKWYQNEDNPKVISLRWDTVEGPFKGRVVFQKIKVFDAKPEIADKHRTMLAAINANAGGTLSDDPQDMDLMQALCNKIMMIKVDVWDMNGKQGNWVCQVGKTMQASAQNAQAPATMDKAVGDHDIPF